MTWIVGVKQRSSCSFDSEHDLTISGVNDKGRDNEPSEANGLDD